MALFRCLNCGHTGNLALTNFVCPICHEQLTLIEGEAEMSLPLCTLKPASGHARPFNHLWRYVTALIAPAVVGSNPGRALWQCDDCKLIVEGRGLTPEEAASSDRAHVNSVEAPQ